MQRRVDPPVRASAPSAAATSEEGGGGGGGDEWSSPPPASALDDDDDDGENTRRTPPRPLPPEAPGDGREGGRGASSSSSSSSSGGPAAWFVPMLNDARRNAAYDAAIRRACRRAVDTAAAAAAGRGGGDRRGDEEGEEEEGLRRIGRDDDDLVVLDIGAGTGLLAMMAARHITNDERGGRRGARHFHHHPSVVSVEACPATARLAREVVRSNGLAHVIDVVTGSSTDATFSLPSGRRAGLCVSEVLSSGLLGEGILPTLRDAWDRHLGDDAVVVPRGATVYAQVVDGIDLASHFRGPSVGGGMIEAAGGLRLETLTLSGGEDVASTSTSKSTATPAGSSETLPLLGGRGWHALVRAGDMFGRGGGDDDDAPGDGNVDRNDADVGICDGGGDTARSGDAPSPSPTPAPPRMWPLTDPVRVMDFDFASGPSSIPPPSGRTRSVEVTPVKDGVGRGVLFWWNVVLWEDDGGNGGEDGEGNVIALSTAPLSPWPTNKGEGTKGGEEYFQEHWKQCLQVLDPGDCLPMRVEAGRKEGEGEDDRCRPMSRHVYELVCSHDDRALSFRLLRTTVPVGGGGGGTTVEALPRPRRPPWPFYSHPQVGLHLDRLFPRVFREDPSGDNGGGAGSPLDGTAPAGTVATAVTDAPSATTTCRRISTLRAAQLNDARYLYCYRAAIERAIDDKAVAVATASRGIDEEHDDGINRDGAAAGGARRVVRVLDVSDFGLGAFMAMSHHRRRPGGGGSLHVVSLEGSPRLAHLALDVARRNGLPPPPDDGERSNGGGEGIGGSRLSIVIGDSPECLDVNDLRFDDEGGGGGGGGAGRNKGGFVGIMTATADVVVGEPYRECLEGDDLRQALDHMRRLRCLLRRGLVNEMSISVPSLARVVCCGIEFLDSRVWEAYRPPASTIRGFRHEVLSPPPDGDEEGGRGGGALRPLPLWKYRHRRLTEDVVMASITYADNRAGGGGIRAEIDGGGHCGNWDATFHRAGACHAVAVWIEYGMMGDSGGGGVCDDERRRTCRDSFRTTFSTMTSGRCQLVHMMPTVQVISAKSSGSARLRCRAVLCPDDGPEDYLFHFKIEGAHKTSS